MSYYDCCCFQTLTVSATKCGPYGPGTAYPGVSVAVKQGGVTVASGTTGSGGAVVFTLGPGTYTVTMTDPNGIVITFTQVIASANVSATRAFITSLSAAVTDLCTGAGLSGAALTFTSGGVTLGTATTGVGGVGSITLTTVVSGTVTVSAVYKGTTQGGSGTAGCNSLCTISYKDTITVTVYGCNSLPLAGATVTISPGSASATTNGSGVAVVTPTVGIVAGTSVSATVAATRFASGTVTMAGASCSGSVTLAAASGYVCVSNCATPLATTLYGTDPLGTFTLTYTGGGWEVCALRTVTPQSAMRSQVYTPAHACNATTSTQTPLIFAFNPTTPYGLGFLYTSCSGNPTDEACATVASPWPSHGSTSDTGHVPTIVSESLACPPAFSYSVTYQFQGQPGLPTTPKDAIGFVYGPGVNKTFTITE